MTVRQSQMGSVMSSVDGHLCGYASCLAWLLVSGGCLRGSDGVGTWMLGRVVRVLCLQCGIVCLRRLGGGCVRRTDV